MASEKLQLTPGEAVEVVSVDDDDLVVEATYSPGGERPPAHRHPNQDEHFEVLAGTLTVDLDGVVREYGMGEEFDVPRGTVHRMAATQRRVGGSKLLYKYRDTFRLARG